MNSTGARLTHGDTKNPMQQREQQMDPAVGLPLVFASNLTEAKLHAYMRDFAVERAQIINITESIKGWFTLIYAPTPEQLERDQDQKRQSENAYMKVIRAGAQQVRRI